MKLSKEENRVSVDPTLYRGMIRSILYLTASPPDISYSVYVCKIYQVDPKESHIAATKRIICYVNGALDYGLWYSRDTNVNFAGFSKAD